MSMRIKELRVRLNLDQKEFADKIGMKPSSYSMLERGHSGLTIKNLQAIMTVFNANANWIVAGIGGMFLTEAEKKQLPENAEQATATHEDENLLRQLLESRDSEIRALKELLEIYKERLNVQGQSKAC